MDKKTLNSLFAEALYQVPDYQRGYAWEEKQWKDFIQDIDALVEDRVNGHYTGTIVVYCGRDAEIRNYGTKRLKVMDVVDGQQRLTSSCLYLSVILRTLVDNGQTDYEREISDFLYSGAICKLSLNNDSANIFYDLLKNGHGNTTARSPHEHRLIEAHSRFQDHINKQLERRGLKGVEYLQDVFHAITQKLHFTFYTIEEECEIGMTFELMNSRGKGLSVLELLKNYLMHWVSRNELNISERSSLTQLINKNWRDTYMNLGACEGNEDQCLRIAWTLYCSHTPKNWKGYDGFKQEDHIPLRNFNIKSKEDTKQFIEELSNGLAEISKHYAHIINPRTDGTLSKDEFSLLMKIHHTGNIANFLPLIVAARMHLENQIISDSDYCDLLKALERYAYRVFLFEGKRSNAGMSSFYSYASEVFRQNLSTQDVVKKINGLIDYYASEESFLDRVSRPFFNWYSHKNLLRYTLFEYELHLLYSEGKGKKPHLRWEDIKDSTFEHILPQTLDENSSWKQTWSQEDIKTYTHDIGNLVLTQNNPSYSNFDFKRKKGNPGVSPGYINSDIRQERKIASFDDWSPEDLKKRRAEITQWIIQRWKNPDYQVLSTEEIEEQEDMDED